MSKKYACITGASSGIGKSFAEIFAKDGYNLVLIARSTDVLEDIAAKLKKSYNTESIVITADLSKRDEIDRCFSEINSLDIEFFINNAGFGDAGRFLETDINKELKMIDLNVAAVHLFSKKMLKYFTDRKGGYLLNVASSAGLLPAGPYMSTYYATKAYVASLTKGIAQELKESGQNIYIGALCPGPVDTGFNKAANVEFALHGITSDYCASYAYAQMKKKKVIIVPSLTIKLAVFARRLISDHAAIVIAGKQQKKKLSR